MAFLAIDSASSLGFGAGVFRGGGGDGSFTGRGDLLGANCGHGDSGRQSSVAEFDGFGNVGGVGVSDCFGECFNR